MTQPNQSELERQIRRCFDGNVEESSDTPLKALLRLTIALSEAGELNG